MHTTFYLARDEYDVLAALPGRDLRKTRHRVAVGNGAMSVDEFHDALEGLVMAEVDLAGSDAPDARFEPPANFLVEVSADERFTGGRLAGTDRAGLRALLEARSVQPPEPLGPQQSAAEPG
jgi:CYTH domain-containing protein